MDGTIKDVEMVALVPVAAETPGRKVGHPADKQQGSAHQL